ncbi:MAG: hypothetical protein H0T60_13600 [Acidobacteria bacterium]|nr:hypothetical protein [Acidobacteriota bacterium]
MNVNLHIERLILDGLDLEQGHEPLLRAALETELTRLITDGDAATRLMPARAVPRVSAPGIETAGGGDPAQLGRQIARSVYDSFGNQR